MNHIAKSYNCSSNYIIASGGLLGEFLQEIHSGSGNPDHE